MAKSNKKQTAEIKKFDFERKNKKNCDHQWYFISRDEAKNKIEWKCNYCEDSGITYGSFPNGNCDGKFLGF
jgi:hypothetical protein